MSDREGGSVKRWHSEKSEHCRVTPSGKSQQSFIFFRDRRWATRYPLSRATLLAMGGTSPSAAGTSQTLPMQAVSSPNRWAGVIRSLIMRKGKKWSNDWIKKVIFSSSCLRNDVTSQSGDTPGQQGNNGNPPSLDSISEAGKSRSNAYALSTNPIE